MNLNILNLGLLYLSTPLNYEEESHLAELEETERKEFGQELENTTRIDHLDTYEDSVIRGDPDDTAPRSKFDNEKDSGENAQDDHDSYEYDRDSYTDEEQEDNQNQDPQDENKDSSSGNPED